MKVLSFRECKRGTLQGFISVELQSGMIIKDITLHEKNGKRWLAMPAKSYQSEQGENKFYPMIDFVSTDRKNNFQKQALSALTEYFKNPAPANQDVKF